MSTEPPQLVDDLIEAQGGHISRIRAANCIDMLCSYEQRNQISGNEKAYWLTPGWLKYWKRIFKGWDVGKANETFPQNHKAILHDPLAIYDEYLASSPQKLLEFSDWMKLPIEPHPVSLDRLQRLLLDQMRALRNR